MKAGRIYDAEGNRWATDAEKVLEWHKNFHRALDRFINRANPTRYACCDQLPNLPIKIKKPVFVNIPGVGRVKCEEI